MRSCWKRRGCCDACHAERSEATGGAAGAPLLPTPSRRPPGQAPRSRSGCQAMIVIRCGGTSVGDAARVANAIDIVAERRHLKPIVVVSALAGITNELIAATEAASDQKPELVKEIIARIRQRHEDVAMQLVQQKFDFFEAFLKQLTKQVDQINTILSGIALLGEITLRAKDK